ncbi:hypothetical protein MRX96_015145 [Rhipicephalus microplus]
MVPAQCLRIYRCGDNQGVWRRGVRKKRRIGWHAAARRMRRVPHASSRGVRDACKQAPWLRYRFGSRARESGCGRPAPLEWLPAATTAASCTHATTSVTFKVVLRLLPPLMGNAGRRIVRDRQRGRRISAGAGAVRGLSGRRGKFSAGEACSAVKIRERLGLQPGAAGDG